MRETAQKRVLQVVASSRGGGAVHVRSLARALAEAGYAAGVAMPPDGGQVRPEDLHADGTGYTPLPHPAHSPLRSLGALAGILRTGGYDLVHAHGSRAVCRAYWALMWAGLRKTPLVISFHGFATPFHPRLRRWAQLGMERLAARRAGAVIAAARAEAEALVQARVAPRTKVHTVMSGFDLSAFAALGRGERREAREALGIAPEAWMALTVCRLDRPRDFTTLLGAFQRVADQAPSARLDIVGVGPLAAEVEAMVAELGLGERVALRGRCERVEPFYAAADAFVLTSWGWEGLPTGVIEAQAAGLPVVVTDAGGAREAFRPGETGLLAPRRDVRALAEALGRLAAEPELGSRLGRAGREHALACFDARRMAEETARIYDSLVQ